MFTGYPVDSVIIDGLFRSSGRGDDTRGQCATATARIDRPLVLQAASDRSLIRRRWNSMTPNSIFCRRDATYSARHNDITDRLYMSCRLIVYRFRLDREIDRNSPLHVRYIPDHPWRRKSLGWSPRKWTAARRILHYASFPFSFSDIGGRDICAAGRKWDQGMSGDGSFLWEGMSQGGEDICQGREARTWTASGDVGVEEQRSRHERPIDLWDWVTARTGNNRLGNIMKIFIHHTVVIQTEYEKTTQK